MSWIAGIQLLAGAEDFSLIHSIQTGSGTEAVAYPVGKGALSSRAQRKGNDADRSPLLNAEVKNGRAEPLNSPQIFTV
jgi:hypothetical protein